MSVRGVVSGRVVTQRERLVKSLGFLLSDGGRRRICCIRLGKGVRLVGGSG